MWPLGAGFATDRDSMVSTADPDTRANVEFAGAPSEPSAGCVGCVSAVVVSVVGESTVRARVVTRRATSRMSVALPRAKDGSELAVAAAWLPAVSDRTLRAAAGTPAAGACRTATGCAALPFFRGRVAATIDKPRAITTNELASGRPQRRTPTGRAFPSASPAWNERSAAH
jgi:hypothetical protein